MDNEEKSFQQIKETYEQFEHHFNDQIQQLKTQIETTKTHLKETVDKYCEEGLPSIIPDQIVDLMNYEMQQYCEECTRVIGNEINKLKEYHVIDIDNLLTVQIPEIDYDDHGKSTELFEKALSSSSELLALLEKNQ